MAEDDSPKGCGVRILVLNVGDHPFLLDPVERKSSGSLVLTTP